MICYSCSAGSHVNISPDMIGSINQLVDEVRTLVPQYQEFFVYCLSLHVD